MAKKQTNGKDPAVLLYTQDFIVGTLTMTNEQKGKYITLLCFQHQKENKLTLNDLAIAEGDEVILNKFPLHSDGYYYNDRLAMEIENRKVRTDSSRKNGTMGGRPKKQTYEKPMGYDLDNLNEIYNKPNYNPIENEAENENVIENENENDFKYTTGLIEKILDRILQYENTKLHREALEDLKDCGGIDKISEFLNWDESVKQNYIKAINQHILIHNDK